MRRIAVFLLLVCAAWPQDLDLMIRGGKLVDGSGNPWRMVDVGIADGKIVAVGDLKSRQAAKTIDATGLVVAPGFIDIHNHSDETVVADGNAESMVRQGVTSMIFGEGGSAAPVGGKQGAKEGSGYADFNAYFAQLQKQGISPNIGTYVGSSQIWTYVRGPQAGPPTAAELTEMQNLVRTAMQQGALGVSSSLSGPPGSWIDTATLIAMCKVASEFGGIYSTHMRTEGQGVFDSIAEALEIGKHAKIPVDIIHLKLADHKLWGKMPEVIATIRQAREKGQQVEAHVYPYRAGQNNLSSILPPWAHEGGTQAMLDRLQDPATRAKIREQVLNGIPDNPTWYNHYTATGSWEGMLLVSLSNPEYKKFEGKRMNEVITALGGDPVDVLFKVLQDNRGSIPTIYFHHSEEDMRHALQQPFVSIGSDGTAVKTEGDLARGNPHPRYYGTFPRVLGRYVRDEKVITLEEAVRKMTSANAAKIGIYDRGLIRPGLWADITIFNPQTVIDNSIWDKPHQYASGIEYVLVNGELVLDKGEHTGAHPGKILYGPGRPETTQTSSATPAVSMPERSVAEWVIRSGGNLRLKGSPKRIYQLAELPAADFRIEAVDLIGTDINPKEMKNLSGLSELTELFLPGPIFNPGAGSRLDANDELQPLATLSKLEKLHFSLHFLTNINVQDKGLERLKNLTGMKELRLTQTRIKGPGLAAFTHLRKLDLNYSTFADEGMPYLAKMRELEDLSLRDTLVTDTGLKNLSELTNLVSLDLYGARITDAGVRQLAGLKKLQRLNLLGATISDEGAQILASLTNLRELNLYRSQITNVGLSKLAALKNLQSLDVRYTRVSRGGVEDFRRSVPGAQVDFQDSAPQVGSAELRQSRPTAATEQAIAEWVTKLGGKATIREGAVREVHLSRTPVTDAQLAHLQPLKSLTHLDLETTEVGDLGVAALAQIPSLEHLNLGHTMTSDNGLKALGQLPNLKTLFVRHSLVETLAHVAGLRHLQTLSLEGCDVRDSAVAKLAELSQLRDLDLSYTEISDAALSHVSKLSALETLDLNATEAGDAGLAYLASMPQLKRLRVNYGRFTDKGVQALAPLKNLVALELARSRVGDPAMEVLSKMTSLRSLNLDYTNVSDKGLALLANGLPELEELRLDSANLSDAAIADLSKLTKLKELNLYHTLITQKAHDTLKQALPNTRIVYDAESALPTRRKS